MNVRYESGPIERVCPVCKAVFMARSIWAYQRGCNETLVFYCSWRCMRKADREKEEKQKAAKSSGLHVSRPYVRLTDEEKEIVTEMLLNGYQVKDIAAMFGKKNATIAYYRDKVMQA